MLGIQLLYAIGEELKTADLSRALQVELENILVSFSGTFWTIVDQISRTIDESSSLFSRMLIAMSIWLEYDLSLSRIFHDHNLSFEAICRGLLSSNLEAKVQALEVTKKIFSRPLQKSEIELLAVNMLTENIVRSVEMIERHNADEIIRGKIRLLYVDTFTVILQSDMSYFTGNGYDDAFFAAYIYLISGNPRCLFVVGFEFWIELLEGGLASADPAVESTVMPKVMKVIAQHCEYFSSMLNDCDLDEDLEDIEAFRDVRFGIQELLCCFFRHSPPRFFLFLKEHMSGFSIDTNQDWYRLEVVLYLLTCVMEEIKIYFEDCNLDNAESVRERADIADFLYLSAFLNTSTISRSVAQLSRIQIYPLKFCGSITHLTVGASIGYLPSQKMKFQEMFSSILICCLNNVISSDSSVSYAAGKSFHQQCIHGEKQFRAEGEGHALLHSVIMFLNKIILSGVTINTDALLLVYEALVRCMVKIENDLIFSSYLVELCNPLIQQLNIEIDSSCSNVVIQESRLKLIIQIIRFIDYRKGCASNSTESAIAAFLSGVFSSVERLECATHNKTSDQVKCLICDFYDKVLPLVVGKNMQTLQMITEKILRFSQIEPLIAVASSLHVASNIVQYVNHSDDMHKALVMYFHTSLTELVKSTSTTLHRALALGNDEVAESFFSYAHHLAVFSPYALTRDNLVVLSNILISCLERINEKDPLRSLLTCIQRICAHSVRSFEQERKNVICFMVNEGVCERLVYQLLELLGNGRLTTTLLPNVIDTIHCVFGSFASLDYDISSLLSKLLLEVGCIRNMERKELEFVRSALVFYFKHDGRLFRSLLQDVSKISTLEASCDVLLSYCFDKCN